MGIYYEVIDPSIFITTIILCIVTIIMTYKTNTIFQDTTNTYTILGLIMFYSLMFLLFNFRFIYDGHNKKNRQDAYRKSYNALYDYGERHRDPGISFSLTIIAFMGFMAALTMLVFGIYIIIIGSGHNIPNDENLDNNNNEDSEPIPNNIATMLFITGVMCIICSIIALARMPMEYLFISIGLKWLL
jgi:uncharacterized membrane protein